MDSRTISFNARRSSQMTGSSSTAARLRSSTTVAAGGRSAVGGSVVGSRLGSGAGSGASASSSVRRGVGAVYGGAAPSRTGRLRALVMRPFEWLQGLMARMGQRMFIACLVAGIAALSIGLLYGPVRSYYVACRTNEYLSAQLATLTEQNDRVEQQITALQTQEGIEDEARRRGYVEVGATPVNVTGLPEADADEIAGNGAIKLQEDTELPWYTEFLDSIFHYTPPEA